MKKEIDRIYNVLIVEDEMMIASHIKATLEAENFKCAGIAKSYFEAISLLENIKRLDFVILDININGKKNGIELAETINKSYQVPFLYLTSYSDRETLAALKRTKPLGYLSKPINEIELITSLQIAGNNFQKKKIYIYIGENTAHNRFK
jgi:DNA-binding NarL/FixJ family response regulator